EWSAYHGSIRPPHLSNTPDPCPIPPGLSIFFLASRARSRKSLAARDCSVGLNAAAVARTLSETNALEVTMLNWFKVLVVLVALVVLPSTVFAQATASIVGTARDASGAVLPGVTVEASSPVLIEKTRTVVTGGAGLYSIESLPPGTYTVTFTLAGFN